MDQKIKNFLEFNNRTLIFLNKDGIYWVAIRPICEALNIDYKRAHKNLKNDPIFGPASSNQTIQTPLNQGRNMTCVPERYVYGWIMSLQSKSPELLEFKKKCYDILYDYFHGSITGRRELLIEKTQLQIEIEKLQEEIRLDPKFKKLQQLRIRDRNQNKLLKKADNDFIENQLELFAMDEAT